MRKKRNRSGMQNYDWRGRYCASEETIAKRKEHDAMIKARDEWLLKQGKKESKKEALRNRAKHKRDPYLIKAFDLINGAAPYSIKRVSDYIIDNSGIKREIDIITNHCLIEVKKNGKKSLKQLISQKEYCEKKRLNHIVYSPNMSKARRKEYEKHGLTIVCKPNALVDIIKRYEK